MYSKSHSFNYARRPSSGGSFRRAPHAHGGRASSYGRRPHAKRKGPGPGISHADIMTFIRKAENLPPAPKSAEVTRTFAEFPFQEIIQRNLKNRGFIKPTPIQDKSIPVIIQGRDIIGLANTGTGKTGAFLLPLIEKILLNPKEKALIIAPTRELAIQIEGELREFARGTGLSGSVVVGGVPIGKQMRELSHNPSFVIATPGRLMDVVERKMVVLSEFGNVVLDEVDRMLDMGFVEDIRKILRGLPKKRQSLFFSATMPPKIRELANTFLITPVTVDVQSGATALNVAQEVIRATDSEKFQKLQELLRLPGMTKALIFSETKRSVEKLAIELSKEGFKAHSLHGDKRQRERERVIKHFRESAITILVATDVAARGLDVEDITHVINYTAPQTHDTYVHRIGRTGRGSNTGRAVTFV